jgi:hypothetical protein
MLLRVYVDQDAYFVLRTVQLDSCPSVVFSFGRSEEISQADIVGAFSTVHGSHPVED